MNSAHAALLRAAAPTRDYRIRWLGDRMVPAACHVVGCEAWTHGWDTLVDERTPLGREQAAYIRQHSGRTFRELAAPDGLTVFRFEPHQRCFAEHQTRGVRLIVANNGRQLVREHTRLEDIAEDYTEHTGRLADQAQKG